MASIRSYALLCKSVPTWRPEDRTSWSLEILPKPEIYDHALYPQAGKAQRPNRIWVYADCVFLKMRALSTLAPWPLENSAWPIWVTWIL